MAKLKVSELTSATSTTESDQLYIVQSNTSKKISVADFFADISNPSFNGNVKYAGTATTVSSPGQVGVLHHTVHLEIGGTASNLTIASGSSGQVVTLLTTASSGGSYLLQSNIAGNGKILFNRIGDTATLRYENSKWFFISGSANLSY